MRSDLGLRCVVGNPEPELTEPGPTPLIPAAVLDELLLEPTGRDDADDEEGCNAAV